MPPSLDGLVLAALLLQVVVPLFLIARIARAGHRDGLRRLLDAILAALYLVAIGLAGLWLALPRWLVGVYAALWVGAVLVGARGHGTRRRAGRDPAPAAGVASPRLRSGLLGLPWVRILAVPATGAVVFQAWAGRRPLPGEPMELTFPMAGGPYRVAAGGSNTLLNPHLGTLEGERFLAYRGQSYGVDLVGVGAWGSRTSSPLPDEPAGWAVFGQPVGAPCAGTVVFAADGQPDRLPAGAAPASLEGNHVILACGRGWVVLAHLARGTVAVAAGDTVETGAFLGRVGNSGSSDEPHLHIHAQTPGTAEARLGGSPLPITFDGRHPARNDRVHGKPEYTIRGPRPPSPTASTDGFDIRPSALERTLP